MARMRVASRRLGQATSTLSAKVVIVQQLILAAHVAPRSAAGLYRHRGHVHVTQERQQIAQLLPVVLDRLRVCDRPQWLPSPGLRLLQTVTWPSSFDGCDRCRPVVGRWGRGLWITRRSWSGGTLSHSARSIKSCSLRLASEYQARLTASSSRYSASSSIVFTVVAFCRVAIMHVVLSVFLQRLQ